MLCQHCNKNEATTHVKTNINGKVTEYMLCEECAQKMGYTDMFPDFHTSFESLLGSFFSPALPQRTGAVRCPVCRSSYNDISQSGKVGCAMCYETFFDELMPTIRRVHGNTEHIGKRPKRFSSIREVKEEKHETQPASENKADRLKAELDQAIKTQNFERAAEIRDELKGMEG